ncbi:hypothetical protein [Bremerella sp. P1]|uniref:hypothetical protein n=1 Tax=Bremerella sp. P1 TaxID=3026424 RepID=UPI002368D3F6|nr:hypothetical protein [Bremerella sp. P1]WDI41822.1 hypothetical protein PSR63_25555 [Bremerella sp. P1]
MSEFKLWLARSKRKPLPDTWLQSGMIAAMSLNAQGGKKGTAFTPEEIWPHMATKEGGKLKLMDQLDKANAKSKTRGKTISH